MVGCGKSSTVTPTPSPSPSASAGPDTVYVQDNGSKTVRRYRGGSQLNGLANAAATLPTSDVSNPDVVYSPLYDVLWYPSAYPSQTFGGHQNTPIRIWTTASTKNNVNPDQSVPFQDGAGTATYDPANDLLYVANVDGPTIQVFRNAHLMTAASLPAANITLGITDGSVAGTPRPQEMLLDTTNGRLFVSDQGAVVAAFDNFQAQGAAAAASGTNINLPASREITGLNSPDGLAYSAANDVLFIGELSASFHRINVIHSASTFSGPSGHSQLITGFSGGSASSGGPAALQLDAVRDLLFVYDPGSGIDVIPAPEVASGNVGGIANRRLFFDSLVSLSGFGMAIDTTH